MSVRWLCYRILAAGPLAACSSNSPPSTAAAGRVPTADPKRSPHAGRMLRALGARGGAVAAAALLVLAGITRTYSEATAPSVRVPAVLEYGNLRAYYEKVAAAPTLEDNNQRRRLLCDLAMAGDS